MPGNMSDTAAKERNLLNMDEGMCDNKINTTIREGKLLSIAVDLLRCHYNDKNRKQIIDALAAASSYYEQFKLEPEYSNEIFFQVK